METQTVATEKTYADRWRFWVLFGGRAELHIGWFSRWNQPGRGLIDASARYRRDSIQRFYAALRIWRLSASVSLWDASE